GGDVKNEQHGQNRHHLGEEEVAKHGGRVPSSVVHLVEDGQDDNAHQERKYAYHGHDYDLSHRIHAQRLDQLVLLVHALTLGLLLRLLLLAVVVIRGRADQNRVGRAALVRKLAAALASAALVLRGPACEVLAAHA